MESGLDFPNSSPVTCSAGYPACWPGVPSGRSGGCLFLPEAIARAWRSSVDRARLANGITNCAQKRVGFVSLGESQERRRAPGRCFKPCGFSQFLGLFAKLNRGSFTEGWASLHTHIIAELVAVGFDLCQKCRFWAGLHNGNDPNSERGSRGWQFGMALTGLRNPT